MAITKEQVCQRIGAVLLDIQKTEKALKLCVKIAFPDIEKLLTGLSERIDDPKYERNTLGQILRVLRDKVEFQDDYETILSSFLANRNDFAHNLAGIDGWDLNSSSGIEVATKFLDELAKESLTVRKVTLGILTNWRVQSGHDVSEEEIAKYEIPSSLQTPLIKSVYRKNIAENVK